MDQQTLNRIAELIEIKRNTDDELATLVASLAAGESKPRRKWTRRNSSDGDTGTVETAAVGQSL
jgi:hypothetical protein